MTPKKVLDRGPRVPYIQPMPAATTNPRIKTAEQAARSLTPAQWRALANCIDQDPTGERINMTRGRSRAAVVECDLRSSGPLVAAGCLAHAPSWDDMFTVTPFGREVAKTVRP